MQTQDRTDPLRKLESALDTWMASRGRLAHTRSRLPSGHAGPAGAQLAPSPEAMALFEDARQQEAECARRWDELVDIESELASARAATFAAREPWPVNILVVDDEARDFAAVQAVLDDPGYKLVHASSGRNAVRALMTGEFACVLLDAQMPGMTGFELAQLVTARRCSSRTPVIFLTAHYHEEQHALDAYGSGAVDYVHKPFNPAVLRQKVAVFADLHRLNRQFQLKAAEREQVVRLDAEHAAASEAKKRADFLAHAGRELLRLHDFEDTVRAVLDLAVPMLGDAAILAIAGTDGAVARLEKRGAATPDNADHAFLSEGGADIERVIRSGGSHVWSRGDRAGAICALAAGDGTLGVLAVVVAAPNFDAAHLELVREFSSRAAIALECARLNTAVLEADRAKGSILAMLAHELRNPLAPISNAAQLLRLEGGSPTTTHWACEVIGRQAARLARLIDVVVDVARLVQGKIAIRRETLDLARIVEAAVQAGDPESDRSSRAISVELPSEPMAIEGDADLLVQAVSQLVGNASKFSAPDTTIRIAARYADGEARILVTDEGVGIAPELLPRIFDLFAQGEQALDRPRGGLGLGLTLVRHVVELHGGRVAARSAGPGKGTEVEICVPAKVVPPGHPGQGQSAPVVPRAEGAVNTSRRRVLVVDDQAESAQTLTLVLESKGHDVRVAYDGMAALQVAAVFEPEVVILDIGLPGMDGFEVARRLRDQPRSRGAVLIALTGYGDAETRSRSVQAGFDAHMTKPADFPRLLSMLNVRARKT